MEEWLNDNNWDSFPSYYPKKKVVIKCHCHHLLLTEQCTSYVEYVTNFNMGDFFVAICTSTFSKLCKNLCYGM
jgi:hypothetical protein